MEDNGLITKMFPLLSRLIASNCTNTDDLDAFHSIREKQTKETSNALNYFIIKYLTQHMHSSFDHFICGFLTRNKNNIALQIRSVFMHYYFVMHSNIINRMIKLQKTMQKINLNDIKLTGFHQILNHKNIAIKSGISRTLGYYINTKTICSNRDIVLYLYKAASDSKNIYLKHFQRYRAKTILNDGYDNIPWHYNYCYLNPIIGEFNDFRSEYRSNVNASFDFRFVICCRNIWPEQCPIKIVNKELQHVLNKTENEYANRHFDRNIIWKHKYGNARIFVEFNKNNKKLLNVSFYTMLVLLCFNYRNTLNFAQIMDLTNISTMELMNILLSLSHPKYKILRKSPNTIQCELLHKFQINPKFRHQKVGLYFKEFNVVHSMIQFKQEIFEKINVNTIEKRNQVRIIAISDIFEYEYADHVSKCIICGFLYDELCADCQTKDISDADTAIKIRYDCVLKRGSCNHIFHFHCIVKWIGDNNKCPIDQKEWEFVGSSEYYNETTQTHELI